MTNYLQLTKTWFQQSFGRDLEDDSWNEIDFDFLLKERQMTNFCVTIARQLLKEHTKSDIDFENIHDHIINLYEVLEGDGMKKAFEGEYKGPALKHFEKHVNDCYNKWQQTRYHWRGPYFPFVQSSGYGKSRLCKEFACTNQDWLTVYICLQSSSKKGYPHRHSEAASFLGSLARGTAQLSSRISSMQYWINAWQWVRILFWHIFLQTAEPQSQEVLIDELPKYIAKFNEEAKQQKENLFNLMEQDIKKTMEGKRDEQQEINERRAFWDLCENRTTANQLHQCVQQLCDLKCSEPWLFLKVLLVIDEASFLINTEVTFESGYTLFRVFRASLKDNSRNVLAVLVDTTPIWSSGTLLKPDPSSRWEAGDYTRPGEKLLPSFHWVTTTDVLADSSQKGYPFTLGRPLWHSAFLAHCNGKLVDLITYAWDKLSCNKTELTPNVVIAMIAVLTGIRVLSCSSVPMNLVGSHMATCLAIDDDHEALFIAYPTEPILCEAALNRFRELCETDKLRENIFDPLLSHLQVGKVDAGDDGALVGKLLFLLARSMSSKIFDDCDLNNLLETMLPETPEEVPSGKLSYTCFSKVPPGSDAFDAFRNHDNPQSVLKRFYERRAAIEFSDNETGPTLLFPVSMSDKEYKYFLIQMRNVAQLAEDAVIDKLEPEDVFGSESKWVGYSIGFSMLIILGLPTTEDTKFKAQRRKISNDTKCLIIQGLDAFNPLASNWYNVKQSLRAMMRDQVEMQFWTDDEQEKALSFDPLSHQVLDNEDKGDT